MNRLRFFMNSAPIAAKLLLIIYIVSGYRKLTVLFQPYNTSIFGLIFSIVESLLALALMSLLFYRRPWVWKLGLIDCGLSAAASGWLLYKGKHIIEHATEHSLHQAPPSDITPEQMQTAIQIGLYSGISFIILSALVTAFLWYRSRSYFTKSA